MNKIFLFIMAFTAPLFAMKEYYGISRSIRALGMGGAFYGLSNDEYAMFYNPAGVSLYEGRPQLMLDSNLQLGTRTLSAYNKKKEITGQFPDSIDALAEYQGTPLYIGPGLMPYFLMKNLSVGILIGDLKADYLLSGKEMDSAVDLTAMLDSGILVTYGRTVFNENFHVGLTTKGIARAGGRTSFALSDIFLGNKLKLNPKDIGGAGFGIDFDLGFIYDIPYLSFGEANHVSLVLNNVLGSSFSMGSQEGKRPPGLVRSLSLGWYSVFPGWGVVDHVHFLADLAEFQFGGESDSELGARKGKILKHLNLGVEVPIGSLALRAGIHQGYFTAGVGINFKYAKLELATYGEELSSGPGRLESRRIGLTLAIGSGQPPQPFKPTLKGKKVEKIDKELEIKLNTKPKVEPKIQPELELDPEDVDSTVEKDIQKGSSKDLSGVKESQINENSLPPSKTTEKSKDDKSLYKLDNSTH